MPSVGIGTNWLGPPVPPPISTRRRTRSGDCSASATALCPPIELPTRSARAMPSASSTPRVTRALRSEREPVQTTVSLRPQPGTSTSSTR